MHSPSDWALSAGLSCPSGLAVFCLAPSAKAHAVFMLPFTVLQNQHALPHHGATGPCYGLKSYCKAGQGGRQITGGSTIDDARTLASTTVWRKTIKTQRKCLLFPWENVSVSRSADPDPEVSPDTTHSNEPFSAWTLLRIVTRWSALCCGNSVSISFICMSERDFLVPPPTATVQIFCPACTDIL